jgi:alkylhydroperoxidase/carboxymuconolactone decarboxylase family protein YurZ
MSDRKAAARTGSSPDVDALLARIRKVPGYVYPFHTYIAEHDYSWLEAHQSWYEQVRAERWLPLKYKELLFVTAALLKLFEPGVRTHITNALRLGATADEILETIEVAAHTGGGAIPVLGVRVLIEVTEGRELERGPVWMPSSASGGSRPTVRGRAAPRARAPSKAVRRGSPR